MSDKRNPAPISAVRFASTPRKKGPRFGSIAALISALVFCVAYGADEREKAIELNLIERQLELDQTVSRQRQYGESLDPRLGFEQRQDQLRRHTREARRQLQSHQQELQRLEAVPSTIEGEPSPSLKLKQLEIERATRK